MADFEVDPDGNVRDVRERPPPYLPRPVPSPPDSGYGYVILLFLPGLMLLALSHFFPRTIQDAKSWHVYAAAGVLSLIVCAAALLYRVRGHRE